ncbi:MAG: hypothetical protein ABSD67_12975 [Terracidiphilus sp.]|jgi:hypothetical protein
MADFAGVLAAADEQLGIPFGVYTVPGLGWFACSGEERRGPYGSREVAERELIALCALQSGLAENWTALAKVVGGGLLWTSVIVMTAMLLTCVLWLVR